MKSSSKSATVLQPARFPWVFFLVLAVVTAIPFGFGKYFELNTKGPFDSGAYVYSAKHILDGAKMGVDEKVTARMGTLLVNMLGVRLFGFSELGPKLVQMCLQITALVFMFVALYRLWGKWAAGLSTFMAAFYLSAPVIAKFGNVKEQYMIAFMVVGVSCYVFRQLGGRWWWTLAAGAVLAWGPMFKQTGLSAIGAVGLFALMQPVFKNGTWKQAGCDVLLLVAGAALSLTPVYLWLAMEKAPFEYYPYAKIIRLVLPVGGERVSAYIAKGRQLVDMKDVAGRVFRYYGILIVPILLALGSIVCSGIRLVSKKAIARDRFVVLFGVWWILDMAFIWISPRSYEQYYLPLNASAAMLGAFVLGAYFSQLKSASFKIPWVVLGGIGVVLMIALSSQVVFGIPKSPHSGTVYKDQTGQTSPRNGYVQRYREVKSNGVGPWESVAAYVNKNTEPEDRIYVWGWYPGVYVQAQRMSASAHAFTSEMHVKPVTRLQEDVEDILAGFRKQPPKYVVDSHKLHFPWNRPVLEVWPVQNRLKIPAWPERSEALPATKAALDQYDATWSRVLTTHPQLKAFGEDEAQRFEAMRPLREFMLEHYVFVRRMGQFSVFRLKSSDSGRETN
ncbi:MAG: hypothetical protein K9N55_08830 [Phycisphaerae bacterium]|nr:hypothetical protein [Phycisphaerae bacterium]